MSRRALLLAIADYDPLPALGYVANDIPRLSAALARAGFNPKDIETAGAIAGGTQGRELTTTRLRNAICDFLESANGADELLIFFSGHGIELDGRRLALPQDYNPKRPARADDLVSDGWISQQARLCKAKSVIVLVDACRDGAHFELAPSKSAQSTTPDEDAPLKDEYTGDATDGPTIAFLYSCAAGEQSRRDIEGEDCSAFTRAFAETIELEKGPAELEAVCAEGQRRLGSYSGGKQTLAASGRIGRAGQWQLLIVKEDQAARFREQLARSNWARRLTETKLFHDVATALPAFAIQLRALAMRSEEQVAEACRVLPNQRWRDDDAWFRQAERIRHVFLSAGGPGYVPAAEAVVLLAVPFVYETALAAAEIQLAAFGSVPDPEAASSASYLVNAWRNAWRDSDAAQIRRGLIARSKEDAADDYACWSLVDFCHSHGELWDAQGGGQDRSGWALDAVTAILAPAPLPEITNDRRVCEILSIPRLLRLTRLMFADFDDVTLDTASGNRLLEPTISSGEFTAQLTINEVRLAHLLNLGSRLALDPRRMPSLLAEHVGADEVLSANWLRLQLANAEWHERRTDEGEGGQDGRLFDLKLDCANDAVDAALLAIVDALESYRTRLLQRQDVHAESMREFLPAGFTANGLNARPSGWHPTRPPLRFELDRTRIIRLLMGQQLYGERWPALRELYQNALDACRYRRAAEHLAAREGRAPTGRAYQGRIVIRFGADAKRRFVECVDNGIGMADRHVRRLFAYAGQRFSDSHEFHIDRARWDVTSIKFFPNSRFGVGVLSYFMLADELDVMSRRWVPQTELTPPSVRARIIGSGSLFRLDSAIEPTRMADDYGTSVRLYLRDDAPDHDTLLKSVLSWLLLPEVAVTIQHGAGAPIELAAGQPTASLNSLSGGVLLPVIGSESTTGSSRLYVVPGIERDTGRAFADGDANLRQHRVALVDGIITGLDAEPWPESLVVNLTEDLAASLTVDRRLVNPVKDAINRVLGWVRANGGKALAAWTNPDFVALYETLDELHPDVAVATDVAVRASTGPIVSTSIPILGVNWPLSLAGASDLDPSIVSDLMLAAGEDIFESRSMSQVSFSWFWKLRQLNIRANKFHGRNDSSLHPVVTGALLSRTVELAKAGLTLPGCLHSVTSFADGSLLHRWPATSKPVLKAVEAYGQVGLREVLRWTDAESSSLLDATQAIAALSTGLLSFDITRLERIGPLHRKLCRLSSGNQLTWIELAYFANSQAIPIVQALMLAQELSSYGISIPASSTLPPEIGLSELELSFLSNHFDKTDNLPQLVPLSLELLFSYMVGVPQPVSTILDGLRRRLGTFPEKEEFHIPNLSREQKQLLDSENRRLLPNITLSYLVRSAYKRQLGTLSEMVAIARSLANTDVKLGYIRDLDDNLVAAFDAIPMALSGMPALLRLFDALERGRPVSVWDLALTATIAKIGLRGVPSTPGPARKLRRRRKSMSRVPCVLLQPRSKSIG